jgi:ELWxxDGT repeat protein
MGVGRSVLDADAESVGPTRSSPGATTAPNPKEMDPMTQSLTRWSRARILTSLAVCGLACGCAFGDPTPVGSPLTYGRVVRLADTIPGTASGISTTNFIPVGNEVYFRASSDGGSLWYSNGHPGGTYRVDTGVLYDPLVVNNSIVYLRGGTSTLGPAGLAVMVQGTSAPVLVAQDAVQVPFITSRTGAGNVKVAGTKVFFARGTGSTLTLWSWDWLTGAQTQLTNPTGTGWALPREVVASGSNVFFIAQNAAGLYAVYGTDGTSTTLLSQATQITYGSTTVPVLAADNGRVYWTASSTTSSGYKLWVSDGTVAGTQIVGTAPAATPTSLWTVDGSQGVYWGGNVTGSSGTNTQLWHFGSTAGAAEQLLAFPSATSVLPLGESNGASIFIDQVGTGYYSTTSSTKTLWITYGSQASTLVGPGGIVTAPSNTQAPVGAPSPLAASVGNEVYFARTSATAGTEVWHVNAATGAMGMMADLATGTTSANPTNIIPMDHGQGVVVVAQYPAWRLWTISPDSSRIRYLSMSTSPSTAAMPVALGSRVFMIMSSTGGTEPWVADLCPADYDNNGTVGTEDLFAYLNDWLNGSHNASPEGNAPVMNDLLSFLNGWIVGCP